MRFESTVLRVGRAIALATLLLCARGLAQDVGGDEDEAGTQPGGVPQGYRVPLANGDTGIHKWVTSVAADAKGIVWVGTEGMGYGGGIGMPRAMRNGNCFVCRMGSAMRPSVRSLWTNWGACWAGHLNHGVSVFNGETWRNYSIAAGIGRADTKAGPIGERVFAITTSPLDGDVWMATSAGAFARYSLKMEVWRAYIRARRSSGGSGLLAVFRFRAAGSSSERSATASRSERCDGRLRQLAKCEGRRTVAARARRGAGLPSNQINAVLATRAVRGGVVYVGTASGLAKSTDHGKSWTFVRGERTGTGRGEPAAMQVPWKTLADAEKLPAVCRGSSPEDCVTAMGEDAEGRVWVGNAAARVT